MPRPIPVNAIDQHGTTRYASLSDAVDAYGIADRDSLVMLVITGGLAPDGKTSFDWPVDLPDATTREAEYVALRHKRRARHNRHPLEGE